MQLRHTVLQSRLHSEEAVLMTKLPKRPGHATPFREAGLHQSQISSRAARGHHHMIVFRVVKPPQATCSVQASCEISLGWLQFRQSRAAFNCVKIGTIPTS